MILTLALGDQTKVKEEFIEWDFFVPNLSSSRYHPLWIPITWKAVSQALVMIMHTEGSKTHPKPEEDVHSQDPP